MKSVSLSGSLRENVGKKDAKKHRRDGNVPCVMYGGKEQIHFAIDEKSVMKIFKTPEVYMIKLNLGGAEYDAIIQDVQFHPVTDRILHVDFLEAVANKQVVIAIPVHLHGTPSGVLKGGRLLKKSRKVTIKAQVKDLPDAVEIDISNLEIGDSVKISDLKADKVTFLEPPTNIVVGVRTARAVVEEVSPTAAAAEGATPAEGDKDKEKDKKEEGK